MSIEGVFHFSFTVSDIEQSVDFYERVVGLTLVHRQTQDNEYTRKFVGHPDARLEIAQFAVPGQDRSHSTHDLELVQYVRPAGVRGDIGINNPGAAHLAFNVSDVREEYDRLVAAGVNFVSPPVQITAGVNEGGWTCYFRDPDQIVLELISRPKRENRA